MSTTDLSQYDPKEVPSGRKKRFAIIVSEWNKEITDALLKGAVDTLVKHEVRAKDITINYVPGSFELIYAAAKTRAVLNAYDAIIVLGSIIRGETPHFDYISQSVMINIGAINMSQQLPVVDNLVPVINGVLTTDDMQQALDRAGGSKGNKGVECAVVALKMASFKA